MSESEHSSEDEASTGVGKYPKDAGIRLAAREGSERYYFRQPHGGIASIPAMNAEQAREIVADGVRGFGPEDFEQVESIHAEPNDYPDPVDSDRDVNEHDLWMLRLAMRTGKWLSRRNPNERQIQALLNEWDDPSEVPLHDRDALQQADGIGSEYAGRIVGAAVANRLIERPVRSDSDE